LFETLSDLPEIGLFQSSTRRKCQMPLRLRSGLTGPSSQYPVTRYSNF